MLVWPAFGKCKGARMVTKSKVILLWTWLISLSGGSNWWLFL